MLWQIESMGQFYDANEGSVVYFDPNTGDTHLLSDFAAFVVQQFADTPLSTERLITQLAPHIEPEENLDVPHLVGDVLEELLFLEILQRA